MMRSNLRGSLAALAFIATMICSSMLCLAQTVDQALDLVPADAEVVVVIPNPKQSSEKIAAFCKKLDVENEQTKDLLGELQGNTHLSSGLNGSAPVVVVIKNLTGKLDAAAKAGDAQAIEPASDVKPLFLILVAMSDKTQFMANFQSVQEANGIYQGIVNSPEADANAFRLAEPYVIFGENADALADYQPGKLAASIVASMGEPGRSSLKQGDLTFWVNLQTLAPKLLPLIDKAEAEMDKAIAQSPKANDPNMAMTKMLLNLYLRAGRSLVRDAISGGCSFDLDPEQGVGLTYMANLKPDSQAAKLLGTGKGTGSLLGRLPAQPYIGALAADLTGMDMTYLVNEIKRAIPADSADMMSKLIRSQVDLLTQHKAFTAAYYPATPKPGSMNLFQAVALLEVNNAGFVRAGLADYYKSLNDIPGATPNSKMYQAGYQPNVSNVQGLSVDQYSMQINMTPEMMGNPAMQFMNMLGITNQSGFVTSKNNWVVTTYGTDLNLLQSALTAMDRTDGLGQNASMNQMRKQLPPNLIIEAYFSIDGTLSGVAPMMMMFGIMPPANTRELPPVAWGFGAKDGSASARLYVPMDDILYVKQIIDQVQAQQQMKQNAPAAPAPGMGGGNAPKRRPPSPPTSPTTPSTPSTPPVIPAPAQ